MQNEDEEHTGEERTQHLDSPPTVVETGKSSKASRNLKLAIVTGLTLASLLIGLLFLGSKPFFGLAFVILLIAQAEFYKSARNAGHNPATALGLVAGAVMLLGVFARGESAAGLVLFLTILFCLVWYMAMDPRKGVTTDIAVTIFGVVYVPMLGSFVGLLAVRPDGRGVVIAAIGAAAIYDIFAYAGGSRFGRTLIAPSISPNKTWEGALIATIGMTALAAVIAPLLGPWKVSEAILLGLLVSITAPLGDLVESMIKRDFGIKDMGAILPGHGGALDRIDAILFAVPAVYLSLRIFGL